MCVLWYRDLPLRNAIDIGCDATTHVQIQDNDSLLPRTFYDSGP